MVEMVKINNQKERKIKFSFKRIWFTMFFYLINYNILFISFITYQNILVRILLLIILNGYILASISGRQNILIVFLMSFILGIIFMGNTGLLSYQSILSIITILLNIFYIKTLLN